MKIKMTSICPSLRCIAKQRRCRIRSPQNRERLYCCSSAKSLFYLSLGVSNFDGVGSRRPRRHMKCAEDECKNEQSKTSERDSGDLLHFHRGCQSFASNLQ